MKWFLLILLSINISNANEGRVCEDCEPDNLFTSLVGFVTGVENNYCEPKENSPVIVNDTAVNLRRSYLLTKIQENKFIIEINPVFRNVIGGAPTDPVTPDNVRQTSFEMRTKMIGCLNEYNKYFLGPNGERLEIKLGQKAPTYVINLVEGGKRANSRNYPEGIDCPTIIHEVLHMLGLCDEYKETSRGWIVDPVTGEEIEVSDNAQVLARDCRAIPKTNSMMGHHKKYIKRLLGGKETSLLMPSHFRLITNPHCYIKNKNYIECARLSMISSRDLPEKNCGPIHKKCTADDGMLK